MIFKYLLSISGDDFYPDSILEKIQGDFMIGSHHNPLDFKPINNSESYNYGGILFWHPKKFSTNDSILKYELEIIEFIERNYKLFFENGVEDFEIYMEIYYDGGQCNFEIFNKEMYKKLRKFTVSLPISIYKLKKKEYKEWENEIKRSWEIN